MNFRVARHTQSLEIMIAFYCDILNFEILGRFENHNKYNGVFIGLKDSTWHLEFTESKEKANHITDEDDILVFYSKSIAQHNAILKNITENHIIKHQAKNPYWRKNGLLIKDPEGFNIIISDLKTEF